MTVTLGQTDRTLRGLHIGRVKGMRGRQAQSQMEGLQELEDQFKVAVAGRAEEFPVWSMVAVEFNVEFVNATGQRNSRFVRPFFNYGVQIDRGGPVGLLACVTEWFVDKRDATTGCRLGIGAVASDQAKQFQGFLHARFQGYGAPAEAYGDVEQLDSG